MTNLDLKVGSKPVKAYITAAVVHFKNGGLDVTVKARGRSISKAVDIAEILKRFEEPTMKVKKIELGTAEFRDVESPDDPGRLRRVSTITIQLKGKLPKNTKTDQN